MFDLEQSIVEWRRQMFAAGIKTPVPLEELEIHLREEIERQMKSGLDERRAFETAVQQMGRAKVLKDEFKKTTMKTLNWKVTILTFAVLGILDTVWLTLNLFSRLPLFHSILGSIVWWVFNAPGMLMVYGFQQYMQLPPGSFLYLLIGAGVLSALIWSAIGGFIFRCKNIA